MWTGRKEPFGHTSRLEPRRRLDSPLGVGYPGVLILVLLPGRLRASPRFSVSLLFSVLYL